MLNNAIGFGKIFEKICKNYFLYVQNAQKTAFAYI
jgi:hypothetical protein